MPSSALLAGIPRTSPVGGRTRQLPSRRTQIHVRSSWQPGNSPQVVGTQHGRTVIRVSPRDEESDESSADSDAYVNDAEDGEKEEESGDENDSAAWDGTRDAVGLPPAAPGRRYSYDIEMADDSDVTKDDVAILLIACAIGLATGFGVVLFNHLIHFIQHALVWREVAFGLLSGLLTAAPGAAHWRCLLLPPIAAGLAVSALRALAGGFDGDPRAVALGNPCCAWTPPPPPAPGLPLSVQAQVARLRAETPAAPPRTPPPAWPRESPQAFAPPRSSTMTVGAGAATNVTVGTIDIVGPSHAPTVPDPLEDAAPQGPHSPVNRNAARLQSLRLLAQPYLKTVAAAVTLGAGASLGPEGPSADLGKANAERLGRFMPRGHAHLDLIAAGAGAGVAAGFGAPMSGVLFAVETMLLQPSRARMLAPQPHVTAAGAADDEDGGVQIASVLVACVLAAMVASIGLGGEPALRMPHSFAFPLSQVPLCVIVGLLCGSASVVMADASRHASRGFRWVRNAAQLPAWALPPLGGLVCGALAMLSPEITYRGFESVITLFDVTSGAAAAYGAVALAGIVLVKIAATALCRASGLVGGQYAPCIFIGSAIGAGFWRVLTDAGASAVCSLARMEVYALVGAAAMLAAFCRVPLTSTLLLFELTQDYTIVVPALAAVGFARWSSTAGRRGLRALTAQRARWQLARA